MIKLYNITKDITWIDHHLSAINKYNDYCNKYKGTHNEKIINSYIEKVTFDGIAGCLLTFIYFNYKRNLTELESIDNPKAYKNYLDAIKLSNSIPEYIKYISDYDTFDLKFGKTIPFMYFFKSYQFNPAIKSEFKIIDTDNIDKCIEEGKTIQRFTRINNIENCNNNGFECTFEGLNCYCLNTTEKSSLTFEDLKNKSKYDAFIVFNYNGNIYNYSIYSNKENVNVSKIAQKYGGGGHKAASGFTSKKLVMK